MAITTGYSDKLGAGNYKIQGLEHSPKTRRLDVAIARDLAVSYINRNFRVRVIPFVNEARDKYFFILECTYRKYGNKENTDTYIGEEEIQRFLELRWGKLFGAYKVVVVGTKSGKVPRFMRGGVRGLPTIEEAQAFPSSRVIVPSNERDFFDREDYLEGLRNEEKIPKEGI